MKFCKTREKAYLELTKKDEDTIKNIIIQHVESMFSQAYHIYIETQKNGDFYIKNFHSWLFNLFHIYRSNIKEETHKEVQQQLEEIILSEKFIDSIVDRIKRKQL